jgi:FkbM family methyltransferase
MAGDVCLDIGAHGGSVTVPLSRAVGPEGHVFAFEARPDYAATLERTLALLAISNVTVLPVAVGERDEKARLVVETAGSDLTGRSHLAADGASGASVPVKSRTLDGLAREIPRLREASFVKIDVEGAELFVLRGGEGYFADARPAVYCEVQDEHCARYGHAAATVIEAFDALGYDGERVGPVDVLFTPRERCDAS